MYTVLARKYRSQTFDEVIGQDPIAKTLKNAIKTKRVAHAYLFTGTRGVGKTTMARILAKALNCPSVDQPTTEPCCKCDSCIAINIGEDIDVIEIDGASNRGIDEVRQLRENAIYRPARGRYKIYIIDEVHMLTVPAFNALLKILEEPPSHIKFIFATTEPNKVIPTIQSRCQRFDFSNISPKLITEQLKLILKQEKIKFDEDLVLPLARMANGSMRDALSLLDRLISTGVKPLTVDLLEEYLGQPNSEKIYNLIDKIGESNAAGTLEAIEDLISAGVGEVQIVDALIDYMRDLMVVKSTGVESGLLILTSEQRKHTNELAKKFDMAGLVYNITALERLRWSVKNSDTPRALLEASLLRFALSEHFMNVDELLQYLQQDSAGTHKKKVVRKITDELRTEAKEHRGIEGQSDKQIKVKSEITEPKDNAQDLAGHIDIKSIQDDWQDVLKVISSKLGNATGSLLSFAQPKQFEDGLLTLEFAQAAKIQRQMCESNGRAEQIQSALSDYFGLPIKIQLETADQRQTKALIDIHEVKTVSQRRNEIINDPAVKTVILGLDATVTGIDEDP
jgi:DNA polymerase-3 subunit gamma/tau